jgi:hypothetical protein
MKIWKLQIFWDDGNSIIKFAKKLSHLERERIEAILRGGVHIHKNPKRKREDPGNV